MNKIWCFYHSVDFDGQCSGAIVYNYYKERNRKVNLVGINYGESFPWTDIGSSDTVYMVDFGIQPFKDMVLLNSVCDLVWIDHHQSALNDLTESGVKFDGIQRNGIGACALVWEYLYPNIDIPYAIKLLSEYDVWIHDDPNTLPFQYGLRLEPDTQPDSDIWVDLFETEEGCDMWGNSLEWYDVLMKIINNGKTILEYETKNNELYCKHYAFETEINGLKAIAVNKGLTSSAVFDSVWDNTKYDCMLTFSRTKRGHWTCSLYTDKEGIDTSITAKKYGGGGHVGASGFQCDELPFKT